jgi:hypothetical protein
VLRMQSSISLHISDDRLGEKISREVSREFPHPVFLEFEKVMFPSMMVNRKVLQFYDFILAIRGVDVDFSLANDWGDRCQRH